MKRRRKDKIKIKQLADYAISECTQHSDDGRWSISYEELRNRFSARVFAGNRNSRLLEEELRQREEISELIMTEDCIEMICHLEYCEQCGSDPLSLLSARGCNIYDEHKHESAEHSDEENPQTFSM
ncbi:MAG: hypothetical protein NC203_12395 [Firmicutes bacterium]|nr:hypothetical protein [Bacillota bacterium]